jgi:hypothetical protein
VLTDHWAIEEALPSAAVDPPLAAVVAWAFVGVGETVEPQEQRDPGTPAADVAEMVQRT